MLAFPKTYLSYGCANAFATLRHEGLSLPFLKENGELLSIASSIGMSIKPETLNLYTEFYDKIDKLCELYPSFFRFFMAITLDLEDLGMPGEKSKYLSDFIIKNDIYTHETSDTRRVEILNLLDRAGCRPNFGSDSQASLEKRINGFMGQPDRFVKFNRPLFYELTHIIFFATNCGQKKRSFTSSVFDSLNNIGMLAYLDDDMDLLSEVCLCFIFLGATAPEIWVEACRKGLNDIKITFKHPAQLVDPAHADDYHIYFVINWLMGHTGQPVFDQRYQTGIPIFTKILKPKSTLAKIFQTLHPIVIKDHNRATPIKTSDFLSNEDSSQLETALSLHANSTEFFQNLTHGHILIS